MKHIPYHVTLKPMTLDQLYTLLNLFEQFVQEEKKEPYYHAFYLEELRKTQSRIQEKIDYKLDNE